VRVNDAGLARLRQSAEGVDRGEHVFERFGRIVRPRVRAGRAQLAEPPLDLLLEVLVAERESGQQAALLADGLENIPLTALDRLGVALEEVLEILPCERVRASAGGLRTKWVPHGSRHTSSRWRGCQEAVDLRVPSWLTLRAP